jgi:hypothetical protein
MCRRANTCFECIDIISYPLGRSNLRNKNLYKNNVLTGNYIFSYESTNQVSDRHIENRWFPQHFYCYMEKTWKFFIYRFAWVGGIEQQSPLVLNNNPAIIRGVIRPAQIRSSPDIGSPIPNPTDPSTLNALTNYKQPFPPQSSQAPLLPQKTEIEALMSNPRGAFETFRTNR